MSEKILSIKEATFRHPSESWYMLDGYIIKTDKQSIFIGISNHQSCCESWGHITSEDSLDSFIGSDLLDIKLTDKALNTKIETVLKENYHPETMFVDINTSVGSIQFVLYNAHNGYYGHTAYIKSTQLSDERRL